VYDTVLIPALALAEAHWHRGELAEGRHKFILQSLKEIIEDLGQRQPETQMQSAAKDSNGADGDSAYVELSNSPPVCILSLPARDEADEIAAMMLAQVLEASGCVVQAVSVTGRASEMVDLVEQRQPAVVCISATPPTAVMHARYLCTRLRARMPEVSLVVGLWDTPGDLMKAKKRIGCGQNTHVMATLAEAQEQIRLLIEPLLPPGEKQTQAENGPRILEAAHV
jgi:CheY-like chemotaxis protein